MSARYFFISSHRFPVKVLIKLARRLDRKSYKDKDERLVSSAPTKVGNHTVKMEKT